MIALVMFLACLLMLALDFPVAFTFGGYAPESAAMGAVGAIILALMGRKLRFSMLHQVAMEITQINAIMFTILAGATFYSLIHSGLASWRH